VIALFGKGEDIDLAARLFPRQVDSRYRGHVHHAALLRMGAAKLGRLHAIEAALGGVGPEKNAKLRSAKEQDQEKDRGGRNRELVAWDGVEPPTRGSSADPGDFEQSCRTAFTESIEAFASDDDDGWNPS
jgi:hypothetical protein